MMSKISLGTGVAIGMLFVLITLWGVAFLLLWFDHKNLRFRWLSGVAFCGGSGALAAVIGDHLRPALMEMYASQPLDRLLYGIQVSGSLASYYGMPYTFLMFAVAYHRSAVPEHWRKKLPYLLLTPALLMFLFTPVYTVEHPYLYKFLVLWVVPYVLAGTLLMVSKREANPELRRTHVLTSIAVVTPVLYSTVMNYVLPSLGYLEMWRYNTWIILFAVSVFVIALFKYGFLGMRLLIEQRRIDRALRTITSGTSMLNHAIKNDVGKMKLFCEKIRQQAIEQGDQELLQDIEVVIAASGHIQQMINRVQDQTQDIPLQIQRCSIGELLDELLLSLRPRMQNIELTVSCDKQRTLECDSSQIREVLNNVLLNALEAMPNGGKLEVSCGETKRSSYIEVRDSGGGIEPHHMKKVMDPFFTTKAHNKQNFGLGLAYCYQVMRKHGGKIELKSHLGQGTAVFLHFPKKRRRLHGTLRAAHSHNARRG